jgi:S-DNA-T family DNA segregation ATPase FtsK/SpoIIIE
VGDPSLHVEVPASGREHDVEMTADPFSTVESLLAVLPIPVGGRPCYLSTEQLYPDDTLEDLPLVAGARLSIGVQDEATRAAPGAVAGVLRVVRGADAGRSYPLPPREVTIGRSARDDVRLTNPLVSRSHATMHVTRAAIGITDNGSANGTESEAAASSMPRSSALASIFRDLPL